jgi:hypothetical protein
MFFSVGEEMLRDEDAVLAQRVARQGGKVVWREFEAMPHVFGFMLEWVPQAVQNLEMMAGFCRAVVEKGSVETSAEFILVKGQGKREMDVGSLTDLTDEKVAELMREGRSRLEKRMDGSVEARPML